MKAQFGYLSFEVSSFLLHVSLLDAGDPSDPSESGADYMDSLMILAGGASWTLKDDATVVQACEPCRVFGHWA